jgi:hypothetical protein
MMSWTAFLWLCSYCAGGLNANAVTVTAYRKRPVSLETVRLFAARIVVVRNMLIVDFGKAETVGVGITRRILSPTDSTSRLTFGSVTFMFRQ